jgi:hypothetical protein
MIGEMLTGISFGATGIAVSQPSVGTIGYGMENDHRLEENSS